MQHRHWLIGLATLVVSSALPLAARAQRPATTVAPARWTGHNVTLEDAARNARAVLVVRLEDLGPGEPGPPGATVYAAARWTVQSALRGPGAGPMTLDLTVQTMPATIAVQRPQVGSSYIVFLGGDSFAPTQVRKLLPDTPENRAAVQRLLRPNP